MRVKIADVAARADVSLITASRALSNPDLVAARTRHRVQQVAKEMGYVPNRLARGLRNGKTQTIAVVTADIQQRLSTVKLETVQREIARRGYHTLLLVRNAAEEEPTLLSACRGVVEGVVLSDPGAGPVMEEARELLAAGVPMVSLEPLPGRLTDVVTADRALGARRAVEHLRRLGHTRIGLALFVLDSEIAERVEQRAVGYTEAMRDAGLEPLVVYRHGVGESLFEDGYRFIAGVRAEQPSPTAWIFPDDEIAVGALRALRDAGIGVPEEIAIIGWDNSPLCGYVTPRLTSISQPVEETVQQAVERLLARIGGIALPPQTALIEPRLVVRESCGSRS